MKYILLCLFNIFLFKNIKAQDTINYIYKSNKTDYCHQTISETKIEKMIMKNMEDNFQLINGTELFSYIFWKRNLIQIKDSLILYKINNTIDTFLHINYQKDKRYLFDDSISNLILTLEHPTYDMTPIGIQLKYKYEDIYYFEMLVSEFQITIGFQPNMGIVFIMERSLVPCENQYYYREN